MEFTDAQKQAILHKNGPCLVLAVPGSGKTTVLLARLRALIEAGVPPESICSITFSRLQARDMQERFQKDPSFSKDDRITFSTIHAFCYRILRAYAHKKNSQLTLMEGSDQWNKYQIVSHFFAKERGYCMSEDEAEEFFRIDGYLKNALITYRQYQKKTKNAFSGFEKISRQYESFKADNNIIDFDDMLVKTLQVLDADPDLLSALRDRFTYFQVDEAQDTSPIQFRIIEKLAAPKNNLFMAADDDQAIYGFRGANPYYLLHFKEIYPIAHLIKMEENYRSSENIVRLSSFLIRYNESRYEKKAEATQEGSEKIQMFLVNSLNKEISLLEKNLEKDLEKGTVAILFRNNLSMIAPAQMLLEKGYAFETRARADRFFRHRVLRDALDILRFSQDPTNLLLFKKIYYKLNAFIKGSFIEALSQTDSPLPVLDRLLALPQTQNRFYQEKIGRLKRTFGRMKSESPLIALEEMEKELGYNEYLTENARFGDTFAMTAQRILEILKQISHGAGSLSEWEKQLFLLNEEINKSGQNKALLTLSTIHGAKGLEYDTVWMIDLIQNEFPSIMALDLNDGGDPQLLEEERRLFYVGMTRAKKRLRLIGRRKMNAHPAQPSQFLDEIQH